MGGIVMASTINAATTGGGGVSTSADASGILQLQTGGTTAVTIDASQNVGIGTATTGTNGVLTVYKTLEPKIYLTDATVGQNYGGVIKGYGITGVGGAVELGSVDNNVYSKGWFYSLSQGYQTFYTGGTERARIDSSGNLLVGTTSTTLQGGLIVDTAAGGAGVYTRIIIGHSNGTGSGEAYGQFKYNNTVIGSITQNGTTGVLYNLTSDYRLKNNPTALTGASEFIKALQPKTWDWWDGSGKGVGFIAHEFMEVAKYSGHGTKDEVDAEGKPVMQAIQPSSSEVMANLVSFVQEQQTLIEALTARLTALEGVSQ